MVVQVDGWWHPTVVRVEVRLKNINEAEYLQEFLSNINGTNDPQIKQIGAHIGEQTKWGEKIKEAFTNEL